MEYEQPVGVVNGANTVFTLSFIPVSDKHISVFVDGGLLDPADFGVVGTTLTLGNAPVSGNQVLVWYFHDGVVSPITPPAGTRNVEYYTLTALDETNGYVTLSNTPATASKTLLDIISGCAQEFGVDFTVIGGDLDWNGLGLDGVLLENDKIRVVYDS